MRKSNASVLESLDARKESVRKFLETFKPNFEYDIVTISDVYGPTGWDPNIQALVVSKETLSGAAASTFKFPLLPTQLFYSTSLNL